MSMGLDLQAAAEEANFRKLEKGENKLGFYIASVDYMFDPNEPQDMYRFEPKQKSEVIIQEEE